MNKNTHGKYTDFLMDAIVTLNTREEAYKFFGDICTVNELDSLAQRLSVSAMLREDKTYHDIAKETGASTATISRVNRSMSQGDGGYDIVLDRLGKK
ncbi:MAG: TrpR YerC/YecD [Lachnospiraceae bacterium]|nr:TrpR YerC/YecD [Lachnospiraceae bacterium]